MAREPTRIYIERMKSALNVVTDEELGKKLGYSKQAIANWRRRDTVPKEISYRMADAFGPQFAVEDAHRDRLELREREVVHAVALYAYERALRDLGRPPSLHDRRDFGSVFPMLVSAVRKEVLSVGFEGEDALTMIELLTVLVDRKALKTVEAVLNIVVLRDVLASL